MHRVCIVAPPKGCFYQLCHLRRIIRNLAERRNTNTILMHSVFLSTCQGFSPLRTIRAGVGARISNLQQSDLGICDTYLVNVSERTMEIEILESVEKKSLASLSSWRLKSIGFYQKGLYLVKRTAHLFIRSTYFWIKVRAGCAIYRKADWK